MLNLKQMIYWVATTLSFAAVSSAEAVTVNFGNPTDPISNRQNNVLSIDDLVICVSSPVICNTPDDQTTENKVMETYNVEFLFGTFDNIFGPGATNNPGCVQQDPDNPMVINPVDKLCFWNNTTGAQLAQTAMDLAINAQSPTQPPSLIADISAVQVPPINFPPMFPPEIANNVNNPTDTEYVIPTGFDGSNLSSVRSSNETNNTWEPNTDPNPFLNDLQMYALFEFQGSETITPPTPPTPPITPPLTPSEPPSIPGVNESSSTIAVILTGVSVLLIKGKKSS